MANSKSYLETSQTKTKTTTDNEVKTKLHSKWAVFILRHSDIYVKWTYDAYERKSMLAHMSLTTLMT